MWRDLLMPFTDVKTCHTPNSARPQGTVPCRGVPRQATGNWILSITPEVFDTRALSATADRSSQAQALKLKSAHFRTLL